MPILSKSNVITGNVVQAADVSQIIDAFTYSGSYDLLISGSVSIGTGSINTSFKTYVVGNLGVLGNISGSGITGSFNGAGQNITGVISASYALSSSYSKNSTTASYAISASLASSSSYAISSSNSTTASYALFAANASSGGGGGNISGSGSVGYIVKFVSSSAGIFYVTSSAFISESVSRVTILTGSSFTSNVSVAGILSVVGNITGSSSEFSGNVSGSSFFQYSSGSSILLQAGSGSFTGTVTAPAFYQSSLRVLKTNIKAFEENALDILKTVDVVSFNYKRSPEVFKIGFVADETHEYLATKDHNVLDVNNTLGLLIKATQELIKENFELKSRIIKLEKGA
jgi:hypothetical protein